MEKNMFFQARGALALTIFSYSLTFKWELFQCKQRPQKNQQKQKRKWEKIGKQKEKTLQVYGFLNINFCFIHA